MTLKCFCHEFGEGDFFLVVVSSKSFFCVCSRDSLVLRSPLASANLS